MSQKIVEQQFHYTAKMTSKKYFPNVIYVNCNATRSVQPAKLALLKKFLWWQKCLLIWSLQDFDPYDQTASKHPNIKPIVYTGEHCMVHPNSIGTVREVLHHVESTNNLIKKYNCRQWMFLISDGVPYIYNSLLQDRMLICKVCREEINGISCNGKEFFAAIYVCDCLQKQILPTNEGYQKWATNT